MPSTDFKVEIQGLKELQFALKRYSSISVPRFQQAMTRVPSILAKFTVKGVVPWRTGNLVQTFRQRIGRLQAEWFPTASYAAAVEFGHKEIRPVTARVLSWVSQTHGQYVTSGSGRRYYKGRTMSSRIFAKKVRKTEPRPFMEAIRDRATPEITTLFFRALDLINTDIANATNQR